MPAQYLLDTSALVRLLRVPPMTPGWDDQIAAGVLAICPVVELELLYSARSKADREHLLDLMHRTFTWVVMPERVFDRAAAVQADLTARGAHRSAGPVDLLVAATAHLHGLTLLHYDRDFEEITKVTGQPATWIAEPGTID